MFLSLASVITLAACDGSAEKICDEKLPELARELESTRATLIAEANGGARAIAATRNSGVDGDATFRLFTRDSRAGTSAPSRWQAWAVERLNEAQAYGDALQSRPELADARHELSRAADEFVAFNGAASAGSTARMIESLDRVRERFARLRRLACPVRQ